MSRARTVGGALGLLGFGVVAGGLGARQLLRGQARTARELIGKPLGAEALAADRVWKKKQVGRIELLLLGDSIAAGLGADKPRHTLGAQLARRLARRSGHGVRLQTAAIVGSESSALRAQLAGLSSAYRPDVAVIVVGGNDVTHRVRQSESARHLSEAIEELHRRGCAVVVGTCPDLGALAAVPQPLRAIGGRASRSLANAQRDAAIRLGARAVSLAEVVGPFFISQPDAMFSVDRFHPSSTGYRRTAKALLPSVLAALGYVDEVPFGHHAPTG